MYMKNLKNDLKWELEEHVHTQLTNQLLTQISNDVHFKMYPRLYITALRELNWQLCDQVKINLKIEHRSY